MNTCIRCAGTGELAISPDGKIMKYARCPTCDGAGVVESKMTGTLVRVKTQPNGAYEYLTEAEFRQRNREDFYGVYRFYECAIEQDGALTGLNAAGIRVVLEEGT